MRRFRINIPHSTDHIVVTICDDKSEYDGYLRKSGIKPEGYGVCIGYTVENYKTKRMARSNACFVILIKDQVGAGYVAHEMTHAILYLLRLKIKRLLLRRAFWKDERATPVEEQICEVAAHVNSKFWLWWNKHMEVEK